MVRCSPSLEQRKHFIITVLGVELGVAWCSYNEWTNHLKGLCDVYEAMYRLCFLYPINYIINMSCHVMLQSCHGFDWFIMNYFSKSVI